MIWGNEEVLYFVTYYVNAAELDLRRHLQNFETLTVWQDEFCDVNLNNINTVNNFLDFGLKLVYPVHNSRVQ